MKVTLLGTSAAEGWPALFCGCDACGNARRSGGKNLRTRSSAIIDNTLKIDLPPDILTQVIQNNLDLRCLQAILFTHSHDDHCAAAELQYRGHYFVPTPFRDLLSLYGSKDVLARIMQALAPDGSTLDPDRFPLQLVQMLAEQTVSVCDYKVTPVRANHDLEQDCFNLLIEDHTGAVLLYATDTGWYTEDTWDFLSTLKIDGVVVEATKGYKEDGYLGHLSIPQVIAFRQRLIDSNVLNHNSPFVTTHMSHLSGLMHEELEDILAPHNIEPGYDGMSFHVTIDSRKSL